RGRTSIYGDIVLARAEPGLMQIYQHAPAFLGDAREGPPQGLLTIALLRTEYVAQQAARVHAHQHVGVAGNIAADQREVRFAVDRADVGNSLEGAELSVNAPFAGSFN